MMHKLEKLNSSIDIIPLQSSTSMDNNARRKSATTMDKPLPMQQQPQRAEELGGRIFRDPMILSSVKTYLDKNEDKVFIDVTEMADCLQRKYRDYGNKKRGPFQAMVRKAYDEITENLTRQADTHWQDEDDEIDIDSDPQMDTMPPAAYLPTFKTPSTGRQNGNSSDKDLMDISSDHGDYTKYSLHGSDDDQVNTTSTTTHQGRKDQMEIELTQVAKRPHLSPSIERVETIRTVIQPEVIDNHYKNNQGKSRKRARDRDEVPVDIPAIKKKTKDLPVVKPSVKFCDIGSNNKVLETVANLLLHMKHPEVYTKLGISPPRRFLLHGPPGCGKTLLAHAVAGELGLPLLKVAAPELVAGVSGESEQRIREMFEQALAIAPCILFLDEIDAVAPNRATAQREMERRIVAQLLSCLDELSSKDNGNKVLVLGTTNRPDSLDPALRRAGRFDREVSLGIPDKEPQPEVESVSKNETTEVPIVASETPDVVTPAPEPEPEVDSTMNMQVEETKKIEEVPKIKSVLQLEDLARLHNEPPLTPEQLDLLFVEERDFDVALTNVQPSAKREGFATVPDVTWDDVGSLQDIRQELQMTILAKEQQHLKCFNSQLVDDIRGTRNSRVIDALKNTNLHKLADCTGSTLLHIATKTNNTYIMKYLIAMGANLDAKDIHGTTPLMFTLCDHRYAESMEILLNAKANIHIEDNNGHSPLSMIVNHKAISYKVARLFFQFIKRNYRTIEEIEQLMTKVNCPMYYAVAWSDASVIKSRLKAGCNVNDEHPASGKTALHMAVRQSELEIVKMLLKHGAKVNARDYNNSTPLCHFNGRNDSAENIEILRILLSRGAVMYKCNYDGAMQIHKILRVGVRKVVKVLMDHGLNLSKLDQSGRTVVHYLAMNRNEDAIEELRGKKFPADLHSESYTPLQMAASTSLLHNVEFLLEHGAEINYMTEWNSMSPLFCAVASSNAKRQHVQKGKVCVELLLRRGADPSQVNNRRETVFDIIRLFDNYLLAQPILLHLAIEEFVGIPIQNVIMKKIQSCDYFEKRFSKYRKQVREFDRLVISESVTLLKFLAESDQKIAGYVRNDRVVERLVRLDTKWTSNSYCKTYLKKRVTKAIQMAQIRKQATVAVGEMVNLNGKCYYNILDRIVDYLDESDIINIMAMNDVKMVIECLMRIQSTLEC